MEDVKLSRITRLTKTNYTLPVATQKDSNLASSMDLLAVIIPPTPAT